MTRISPKVKGNRIGYVDEKDLDNAIKIRNNFNGFKIGFGCQKDGGNFIDGEDKLNRTGRFPTQLFTNVKNERYKFVKWVNINIKE